MIPPSFECPISFEVMRDPVSTVDGHTFERTEIEAWFAGGHNTNPNTNVVLPSLDLIPNLALRNAIEEWRAANYKVG